MIREAFNEVNKQVIALGAVIIVVLGIIYWIFGLPRVGDPEIPVSQAAIERGEYLVYAGGCISCHRSEEGADLSGGVELESPFGGTFHVPNITPDEETGIGDWTGRDFLLAMKHGRSPNGGFYWPAFPYRSYTGMTDEDVLDIAAYLMSQPAVENEVQGHDLPFWQFSWMMAGWNILADLTEGDFPEIPDDPQIQRGAYLARHLGHCGECHTPRNVFAIMQLDREFEGSESDFGTSAAIDPETLSDWGEEDFIGLLELGMTANFDFIGGEMEEVVNDNTSQLTDADRQALAAFFTREPASTEEEAEGGEEEEGGSGETEDE